MGLEITIDNAMRSGSDFLAIWSQFRAVWGPFWDHLGSLGRLLGSLGRLLGGFWAPLGLSRTLLGGFWDVLGPLLGRSWPLLALPGPSGVDFESLRVDFEPPGGRFGLDFGPSETRF